MNAGDVDTPAGESPAEIAADWAAGGREALSAAGGDKAMARRLVVRAIVAGDRGRGREGDPRSVRAVAWAIVEIGAAADPLPRMLEILDEWGHERAPPC